MQSDTVKKGSAAILFRAMVYKPSFFTLVNMAICLLGFCSRCRAQGYKEGWSISYDFLPLQAATPMGTEHFAAGDLKATAAMPLYTDTAKQNYWLFGATFESMQFSGSHADIPPTDLYSISAMAGYCAQVNAKLSLSALLIPLFNTDLKAADASDVHFGAVVRSNYRVKENFQLKFTLGYRQQYYGPQYIVFVGADWKLGDRWRVFGDLPNNATVAYKVSGKSNCGLHYASGGYTSFRLTQQGRYLLYNYAQPGLFYEHYVTNTIALRATAYYSILRNMDVYGNGTKVTGAVDYIPLNKIAAPLNDEPGNGLSLKVAVSMRLADR